MRVHKEYVPYQPVEMTIEHLDNSKPQAQNN